MTSGVAPSFWAAALSILWLPWLTAAPPQGEQMLLSPYWTTERGHDTVLMVGNPVASPQNLTLRLFSDSGEMLLEQPLRLEAAEGRSFSLAELLGGPGSGHLQLVYGGDIRRLPAAGLIRRGEDQWMADLIDSRHLPKAKLLRTVAPSLDPGQKTVIAICNPGSRAAAGTMRISGQRQAETAWQLGPGQSRRIEFRHGPESDGTGLAVEIERFGDDETGLQAAGFSHSSSSGTFALQFGAEGKDDSGQLTGFFTRGRSLLALWNPSGQAETVSLEARLSDGTVRSGQVALESGAVEQFDLAEELGLQPGDEGALLASAGPGRNLLGRIVDAGPGQAVLSNPLRNPAQEDPTHAVPVRLGEHLNTRFLLYNPNPEALRFSLLLYFGSERYTYPVDLLAPFQAAEIDLARARGELLAGQTGGFIPEGEVTGQALIFQRNDLEGRLQLLSLVEEEGGERLSFHCTACQPEPEEMLFEPGSASGLTGQTIDLPPAILYYTDGSSADVTPETTVSIVDTSIATMAAGHRANLLSAGSTSGVGSYTASLIGVDPECLLLVTVIATVIILVQDPPTCEITGPSMIPVGENLVTLATSIQPSGSATSWRNVTGNNVCLPLQPEGTILARAPGQKTIQMTCSYTDGSSLQSNQFMVTGQPTTQFVRVVYDANANSILNGVFSANDVTAIKNRVQTNLGNLFSLANVVFANQPTGGVTKITTLNIRGNSPGTQGGEASFDLMNLTRTNSGTVYVGANSLDLANANDPVQSTPINERRSVNRVADAISRLAAHEVGHMLGLVPRSIDLTGTGLAAQIAAKLMVNGLGLNGTAMHHNPTSNDINIMQTAANLSVDRTWNISLYQFAANERTYLERILP